MRIQWNPDAARHMWDAHGVSATEADEAITDVDALWWRPDPASKSGLSNRCVGYSHTRRDLLVAISIDLDDDNIIGVNAWSANSTYRRIYREANEDE